VDRRRAVGAAVAGLVAAVVYSSLDEFSELDVVGDWELGTARCEGALATSGVALRLTSDHVASFTDAWPHPAKERRSQWALKPGPSGGQCIEGVWDWLYLHKVDGRLVLSTCVDRLTERPDCLILVKIR
jgi:hypothetical protein